MVDLPGLSSFYTPNRDFYRVDTALVVPRVAAEDWRLRVHGRVRRELELDFGQLLARPLIERDITLSCVSNEVGGRYVGTARWVGAPLAELLREAGVEPGADQLVSRSADGFTVGTPTAVVLDGRDAMLAVAMNGEPLPLTHGFPVRMLVPGLYGYVSATKWLVDLELTSFGDFDPYWVRRGWARQAPVKTMSRIDTPRPLARQPAGRVAVAGVAWAQHRGIRRVEVRADGGPWRPARLAAEHSPDTWRQWVWPWEATPGRHTLEVRATDGTGATQPRGPGPAVPGRRHRLALGRGDRHLTAPFAPGTRPADPEGAPRPLSRKEQRCVCVPPAGYWSAPWPGWPCWPPAAAATAATPRRRPRRRPSRPRRPRA